MSMFSQAYTFHPLPLSKSVQFLFSKPKISMKIIKSRLKCTGIIIFFPPPPPSEKCIFCSLVKTLTFLDGLLMELSNLEVILYFCIVYILARRFISFIQRLTLQTFRKMLYENINCCCLAFFIRKWQLNSLYRVPTLPRKPGILSFSFPGLENAWNLLKK